jgi:hypothetical protein
MPQCRYSLPHSLPPHFALSIGAVPASKVKPVRHTVSKHLRVVLCPIGRFALGCQLVMCGWLPCGIIGVTLDGMSHGPQLTPELANIQLVKLDIKCTLNVTSWTSADQGRLSSHTSCLLKATCSIFTTRSHG